jgi:hypothetical protein
MSFPMVIIPTADTPEMQALAQRQSEIDSLPEDQFPMCGACKHWQIEKSELHPGEFLVAPCGLRLKDGWLLLRADHQYCHDFEVWDGG